MTVPRSAALLFALAFPAASPGASQPVVIPDKPTCSSCRVTIGPRALRVADSLRDITSNGRFLAPAGRRRFFAGGMGAPVLYTDAGKPLGPIGRVGSGPREFRMGTAFAIGPDDSVAVFDAATGRISILGPRDVAPARAFPIGMGAQNGAIAWLADGRFAVSGFGGAGTAGFTVHLHDATGKYLRSLAEMGTLAGPVGSPPSAVRLIREIPGGRLVTVTLNGDYVIQVWDLESGRLLRDLRREAPWFRQGTGPVLPKMVAMQVDSAGRLWTLTPVVAPTWERGVKPKVIGGIEHTYEILDRDLVLDSVIEVIDLTRGVLLAQLKTEPIYLGLLPGFLLARAADDDETSGFDLFPVTLEP